MEAEVIQLAPGVFGRQAVDNMGWIDIGDSIVVVDALEDSFLFDEVLEQIRETVGDKPIKYVINTHLHYDHIALNPFFTDMGAEIINARTNRSITEIGSSSDDAFIQIIPLPDLHSPDDLLIHLPNKKVTFIGDLFGWGLIPYESRISSVKLQQIYDGYQTIIDLRQDHLVQGHGPFITPNELIRCRRYFQQTLQELKDGVDDPLPPGDMSDWWRFLDWKHEDTVEKLRALV